MKRLASIAVLTTTLIAGPVMADHDGAPLLNRENIGGALGATVGGLLGSQIGDGDGQLAATAAGAVGGYIVGKDVGHNYGGNRSPARRTYGYEHDRGYKHDRGYRRDHDRNWKKHRRTEPRIHPINETFVARTTSNVRSGPSTRFGIVGRLHDHERVQVIGKVGGRDWFMVRCDGRRGFVYAPLLRPERPYGHGGHSERCESGRCGRGYSSHGGARAGW